MMAAFTRQDAAEAMAVLENATTLRGVWYAFWSCAVIAAWSRCFGWKGEVA